MDHALHLLDDSVPLRSFRLRSCWIDDSTVSWLRYAIKRKVPVLEYAECQGYFIHGCHDLISASSYLTKVVLEHVVLHDCHFGPLNNGCPALENLELLEVNIQFTEISSTLLKHLRIVNCTMDCKFWIRTPNFLTMCLDGVECKSSLILDRT